MKDTIIKLAVRKGYTDIVEYMKSNLQLYKGSTISYAMNYDIPDLGSEDILELLPREILFETIKYSSVEDIVNLCRSNKQYSDLCRNWIDILRFKYPEIKFEDQGNNKSYDKLKYLDIHDYNNDMLIWAVTNEYLDIIKYLLSLPATSLRVPSACTSLSKTPRITVSCL